jgi:DNA-directed RNA polymerase I, II, and III subunit RPABC3
MSTGVFTDTFAVTALNPEGKVFDRIDRIAAEAQTYDCKLLIDVNSELWRVKEGEKISMTLATSLSGEVDDGKYRPTTGASLLDMVSSPLTHA